VEKWFINWISKYWLWNRSKHARVLTKSPRWNPFKMGSWLEYYISDPNSNSRINVGKGIKYSGRNRSKS
jgi:hypothetical protein